MKIEPINSWLPIKKNSPLVIAGPCSAESREQMLNTAMQLKEISEVLVFRAGIWKPRTRPGTFEGLGDIALPWLSEIKKETGLLVTTEVATAKHVEAALKAGVDILWVGARTTANPFSVQEIADALKGVDIPVMVKNPINADLQLWIGALERLNMAGITKLAAIHRGFSVAEKLQFRNAPMWKIPMELKVKYPDLPLICDPSHISGNRDLVGMICQKAMDLDYNGLIIETHPNPNEAWSDASQQVTPKMLGEIINSLVLKKENSDDKNYTDELSSLRSQIDRIDNELLHILKLRNDVINKIAYAKLNQKVTALQKNRFEEMLSERQKTASTYSLDVDYIKNIFDTIHEESVRIQTEIFEHSKK